MNKETIVLFPGLGSGHVNPMLELAKLFANRNFSVIILVVETSFSSSLNSSVLSRISSANPSVSFHRLPKLSSDRPIPGFQLLPRTNPLLLDFLKSLAEKSRIRALVLDMFCSAALDIAHELNLPAYFFYSSPASSLSVFICVPTLLSQMAENFGDLGDKPLEFPGIPPIPASHLLNYLMDREDERCKSCIYHFKRLTRASGIMINTFQMLEPKPIKALVDGLCVDQGRRMCPIYCIGPLVAADRVEEGEGGERHECLKWLDAQPQGSVVFLCFGSMGSFSGEQLKEIANGLERSGQRFLWAVRSQPSGDPKNLHAPRPEPNLSMLMPVGFLERTEGRGMVVKSWTPQAAVLGHDAVGGFVSHCGWNSTLEAVCAGVPMIAWPLYAEQKMNKVFLVEEAKMAVEMKGYDEEMVSADEVETKVRWLMESEGGIELKDRAVAMKEAAKAARRGEGSSDKAWTEFVNTMMSDGAAEQCFQ